jgi:hypothetical protein
MKSAVVIGPPGSTADASVMAFPVTRKLVAPGFNVGSPKAVISQAPKSGSPTPSLRSGCFVMAVRTKL